MQDYTRVSAGLCDMIYNTTLYGIQYYAAMYVVASALALASEVSNC